MMRRLLLARADEGVGNSPRRNATRWRSMVADSWIHLGFGAFAGALAGWLLLSTHWSERPPNAVLTVNELLEPTMAAVGAMLGAWFIVVPLPWAN